MIWYDFKIIFRKIKNSKIFPAINITGLTIGLTCSILAFLFIQDELSFDKHFKNTENAYRVNGNNFFGNEYTNSQPVRFLDNILADIPEVTSGIRLYRNKLNIRLLENNIIEENFIYTDSNFFSFFNWKLIDGKPEDVLSAPNQVVISEKIAREWFTEKNPVGSVLKLDNYLDVTITGIYKDFPKQAHIQADFIASLSTLRNINRYLFSSWGWFSSNVYVKVGQNSNISLVNNKLTKLWNDKSEGGGSRGDNIKIVLQKFSDIYLRSGHLSGQTSNISIVYGIGLLAAFILIIACFNFINLSIALYNKRNVETGIKKSLGANHATFARHVFLEVALYLIFASIVSSFIVAYIIPFLNNQLDKNLSFPPPDSFSLVIFLSLIFLIILAGTSIFPIFHMLNLDTAGILKGSKTFSRKKIPVLSIQGNMRNLLVIIQFTFGIMLILSSIVVNKQLKLIRQKESGFNKEQVMVLINWGDQQSQYNKFKQVIEKYPEVSVVSSANNVPTDGIWNWGNPNIVGEQWNNVSNCGYISVNYEYFDAIGAKFIAGRNFINNLESENDKLIVTETLVKKLNLKNPIGIKLTELWDGTDREIVGVIKDIEYQTIHNNRSPILFFCRNRNLDWHQKIIIKMKSDDLAETVNKIKNEWKEIAPGWPIDYFFLDQKFDANYRKESQVAAIINVLTWIAIFLCCLGLFGLALYNINGRIKEIGVRKINGAKEMEIMVLINKEFIGWILTAFIIAVPLAILFMNKWLENFAYKTDIPWWAMMLAGTSAFIIAMLTVSWQSIKAARRNPVEALRYE